MNQPMMTNSDGSVSVITPSRYPQPPPTMMIMQQPYHSEKKSCGLISSGIIQMILSSACVGLSGYICSIANFPIFSIIGACCAGIFLLTAFFAVHSGCRVQFRQGGVICVMTFSILGLIVAAVGIVVNIVDLAAFEVNCPPVCSPSLAVSAGSVQVTLSNCNAMCQIAYIPVHLASIVLLVLQALMSLIISIAACCNRCSCCCCYDLDELKFSNIRAQPMFTTTANMNMSPVGSPGVPYSRLQEQ